MNDSGHIILHRKILGWEWYADINTCRVFIHMLLKANWQEGKFRGAMVPRGSFVSSISKLAEETKLTNDEVRTAISHLIKTNEITKQSTNKYTVFTVVNYGLYQNNPKQEHELDTGNAQSIPKLFPTIEEINKENKEINKNIMCKADASALFEKLWNLYPVKKGKGQVSLAAKQRLLKVGYEEMARAIDRYKADLERDSSWRKPQNGSTFFNSGYVDYLDANYKEQGVGVTVGTDNKSRGSAADFYEQFLGTGDGD